jgi:predicted metal-dependent hydrolase
MRTEHLQIGSLEVKVKFKPIKNLHLSVHPPFGNVTVSSPEFFDLDKIKVYLITKIAWIKREQKKIASQEREGEKLMITRESHYFLGKRYLLKVTEAKRASVKIHHQVIELFSPEHYTTEQKQKQLDNWYRRELITVLGKLLTHHLRIMNLTLDTYCVRKMKTKWGSCNNENRTLNFNIELIKKPIECIDYIIVHELVHLLERNHNKDFIILMDCYLPNWRTQKKILNDLPI